MSVRGVGKAAWYLCGTILVLSLPTFSYLIPDPDLAVLRVPTGRNLPVTNEASASGASDQRVVNALANIVRSVPGGAFVSAPGLARPPVYTTPQGSYARQSGTQFAPPPPRVMVQPAIATRVEPSLSGRSGGRVAGAAMSSARQSAELMPGSDELRALNQAYESSYNNLFNDYPMGFGGYPGNPFDDASGGDDPGGDDPDPPPDDDGPDPPPTDDDGPNPPPADDDDGQAPVKYDFLLIGEFPGVSSNSRIFRSHRNDDGSFALENQAAVAPLKGVLGPGTAWIREEEDQILTCDINGDGLVDIITTRRDAQGTAVLLYLGSGGGTFPEIEAQGLFMWKTINGLALLDFNRDSKLELAILFKNSGSLFIYEIKERQFSYLKEIVLPFQPGLMLDSQSEGFLKERRLHVFDAALTRVISFTARNPNAYTPGLPSLVQAVNSVTLDLSSGVPAGVDVLTFEQGERVVVAERRATEFFLRGSFDTGVRVPVAIFGDYLRRNTRQLIVLP